MKVAIYLLGVLFSLVICVAIAVHNKYITLQDVISSVVLVFGSWVGFFVIFSVFLNEVLKKRYGNIVLHDWRKK